VIAEEGIVADAAATALVVVFALVGAGAGLLLGSALDSENTAGAASAPVALVLAAIGGCMVPVEVFPEGLRTVSKVTPHYWALESWKELMFDGAGLVDIAPQLCVLVGFAVVLLAASSVVLRRSLVN
jgi:ABC-2 type transport system permease protein